MMDETYTEKKITFKNIKLWKIEQILRWETEF